MNRTCPALFLVGVITLMAAVVANARGQGQADPAQAHVAAAKAAARTDYPGVDALCAAPKPDDRPLPAPGSSGSTLAGRTHDSAAVRMGTPSQPRFSTTCILSAAKMCRRGR